MEVDCFPSCVYFANSNLNFLEFDRLGMFFRQCSSSGPIALRIPPTTQRPGTDCAQAGPAGAGRGGGAAGGVWSAPLMPVISLGFVEIGGKGSEGAAQQGGAEGKGCFHFKG